jgi:hypothetical protein
MKEKIINNLISKEYKVKELKIIKNGVEHIGINIMEEGYNVLPTIYINEIIKCNSSKNVEYLTQLILNIHNENKVVNFEIDKLLDKDYILENVRIALQKKSAEDIIKKDTEFDGIESYLYILTTIDKNNDDILGSMKITNDIVNRTGLDIEKMWNAAKNNTFKNTVIKNLKDIMNDLMSENIEGIEDEDFKMINEEIDNNSIPMFIITNKEKNKGASGILNKQLLKNIAVNYSCNKLIMLPSSIHEVIIIPYIDSSMTIEEFSSMVSEINNTQVSPEERLTDKAYLININ